MFNNMTDLVGYAMHEDRLARATRNRRLAEATQASPRRLEKVNLLSRQRLAHALTAFATRLTRLEGTANARPDTAAAG
jgi:hypothetical protein